MKMPVTSSGRESPQKNLKFEISNFLKKTRRWCEFHLRGGPCFLLKKGVIRSPGRGRRQKISKIKTQISLFLKIRWYLKNWGIDWFSPSKLFFWPYESSLLVRDSNKELTNRFPSILRFSIKKARRQLNSPPKVEFLTNGPGMLKIRLFKNFIDCSTFGIINPLLNFESVSIFDTLVNKIKEKKEKKEKYL
jgi:hypothetical protein